MEEEQWGVFFYSQTLIYGKNVVTPIETGFILDVKQSLLNKQPIYLIESYYKGSSCVGTYVIQGFKLLASGSWSLQRFFKPRNRCWIKLQLIMIVIIIWAAVTHLNIFVSVKI